MSGLKLKVVPQFPARVEGGLGVDVSKDSGIYTIELDLSNIPQSANVPPNANLYVLAFDIVTKQLVLVPK